MLTTSLHSPAIVIAQAQQQPRCTPLVNPPGECKKKKKKLTTRNYGMLVVVNVAGKQCDRCVARNGPVACLLGKNPSLEDPKNGTELITLNVSLGQFWLFNYITVLVCLHWGHCSQAFFRWVLPGLFCLAWQKEAVKMAMPVPIGWSSPMRPQCESFFFGSKQ